MRAKVCSLAAVLCLAACGSDNPMSAADGGPVGMDVATGPVGNVPIGPPESQLISAATGGSLQTSDRTLTLDFPPGALDEDTLITVTPLSVNAGYLWHLEPDGLAFNLPVTATVRQPGAAVVDTTTDGRTLEVPLVMMASVRSGGSVEFHQTITLEWDSESRALTAAATLDHFSQLTVRFSDRAGDVHLFYSAVPDRITVGQMLRASGGISDLSFPFRTVAVCGEVGAFVTTWVDSTMTIESVGALISPEPWGSTIGAAEPLPGANGDAQQVRCDRPTMRYEPLFISVGGTQAWTTPDTPGCPGRSDRLTFGHGVAVPVTCTDLLGDGAACTTGAMCMSGNCVDGVCCNTVCTGLCLACDVAGSVGICTARPAGSSDDTCEGSGRACDATGACRLLDGEPCTMASQCVSSFCADGYCCESACDGACEECARSPGSCLFLPPGAEDPPACPFPASCNASGACVLAPAGAPCADGAGCASGFCTDNICCTTSSCPTCQTCNLIGGEGTCRNLPSGSIDGSDCAAPAACNGSGACITPLLENGQPCAMGTCRSGYCADGVCCNTRCDGECMSCVAATSRSPDGTCDSIREDTDPDSECPGPQTCQNYGSTTFGAHCYAHYGDPCTGDHVSAMCPGAGTCVEGVCCDLYNCRLSGAPCSSCLRMYTGFPDGDCQLILAPMDPYDECRVAGSVCWGGSAASGCCLAPGTTCGTASDCCSRVCAAGTCT